MRKYIISIILIICGLTVLFYSYSKKNNITYSETAFADHAERFDELFEDFTKGIKEDILSVKQQYSDTLKIKDTAFSQNFFLDQLKANNFINSIGFFQGYHKLVIKKENSSFLFAVDSSAQMGIVKWRRFEKGKKISSWYESYQEPVYESAWYKELMAQNNELKWYLRTRTASSTPDGKAQKSIFVGYAYKCQGEKTVIVLEILKDQLFDNFDFSNASINPLISFKNMGGKALSLQTGVKEHIADSLASEKTSDSLQLIISKHFDNFKDVSRGTFNFTYKGQIYWNFFNRLNQNKAIQYYIYTLPNSQLISSGNNVLDEYLSWIALLLIIAGLLLLLIRKRFFYTSNRINIPPVKEILKGNENRYLEFKSSLRWDYRQEKANPQLEKVIMKTIAAFGNTDGGILLIGVDDDKNILGLEKDFQTLKKKDADFYEVHIRNLMHKQMGVKYVSKYIRTQFEEMEDGNLVCKIKVIPAKEPIYLKYKNKNGQVEEKFYVRSGNSSHEIESIAEINDYINTKFK